MEQEILRPREMFRVELPLGEVGPAGDRETGKWKLLFFWKQPEQAAELYTVAR
jgi:hypothetical protein